MADLDFRSRDEESLIHVSDLRSKTACGLVIKLLPNGDKAFAALTDETQAMVNCQACRDKLGLELYSK